MLDNVKSFTALLPMKEHSAGASIVKNTKRWMDHEAADIYLSTGWRRNKSNFVQGGYLCRKIRKFRFNETNRQVLFIGHTRFPYLMEFSDQTSGSSYIRELIVIKEIIKKLPDNIKRDFVFRPRIANGFWDAEHSIETDKNNITVDRSIFTNSVLKSKIIIIDHISTGLSEILILKAPFLLLINQHTMIEKEFIGIFSELEKNGVIHYSADSVIKQLIKINNHVEDWWNDKLVQKSIHDLTNSYLAPPKKTINYLLSCLKN